MTIREETIICRELKGYERSYRTNPFTLAYCEFKYETDSGDKHVLDDIIEKGKALAGKVNPSAANNSGQVRNRSRLINNAIAGLLAEYCWKCYINQTANAVVVASTVFTDASQQIDLIVLANRKKIEVRSSFPRNGIPFSLCHPIYEFDILGPYSNSVKPSEIQKDYYARTLYHVPLGTTFIDLLVKDVFKVYLTGGATWSMMIDNSISKNKTLWPEDAVSEVEDQRSTYRVVPFSRALDTLEMVEKILH